MPEESIIDRAIGLIPGVGKPKRGKKSATAQTQLVALQRNLAKLAKDVEELSRLMMSGPKKVIKRAAAGKRTGGKRRAGRGPSAKATAGRRAH